VNALEPFALLYQDERLPAFALPEELKRTYRGELGLPERCLFANFVSTLDGVVAIPSLRRNRLISDHSSGDQFVMGLLRACADALLVGSGTLIGSPEARWRPEDPHPPVAPALAALRRELGRSERPTVAIVTASGSIDPAHPAVRDGALILTTERGAARLADRLDRASEVLALPGDEEVDLRAAIECLRSRGHDRILTEGGPTLFGSLVEAGLVDEVFLTLSPLLAGRALTEGELGLVEGTALLPTLRVASRILSVRVQRNQPSLSALLGRAAHCDPAGPQGTRMLRLGCR
jgi:riboflavin biosynthesis pyrimidine reductase